MSLPYITAVCEELAALGSARRSIARRGTALHVLVRSFLPAPLSEPCAALQLYSFVSLPCITAVCEELAVLGSARRSIARRGTALQVLVRSFLPAPLSGPCAALQLSSILRLFLVIVSSIFDGSRSFMRFRVAFVCLRSAVARRQGTFRA